MKFSYGSLIYTNIRITESLQMGISLFSDPNSRSDVSPQGSRGGIRKLNYLLLTVIQRDGSELAGDTDKFH